MEVSSGFSSPLGGPTLEGRGCVLEKTLEKKRTLLGRGRHGGALGTGCQPVPPRMNSSGPNTNLMTSCYPHFTDEDSKAQKVKELHQGHVAGSGQRQDSSTDSQSQSPRV